MALRETGPESYITEYTVVYGDYLCLGEASDDDRHKEVEQHEVSNHLVKVLL